MPQPLCLSFAGAEQVRACLIAYGILSQVVTRLVNGPLEPGERHMILLEELFILLGMGLVSLHMGVRESSLVVLRVGVHAGDEMACRRCGLSRPTA